MLVEFGKGDEPTRKSSVKGKQNKKSSVKNAAKNPLSKDEGHQKSPNKPDERKKHFQ